jgi:uncharacterized protein (DUF2384 family)
MLMPTARVLTQPITDDGALLATAVGRIAEFWQLTNDMLGDVLGLSPATASRLRNGAWSFAPGTKPFELAQYLVRLFRSLDALMGSDDAAVRSWLAAANADLDGRPIDLVRTIGGLIAVADHVDGYRSRV